jgi:hypothetical protein
VIGEVREYIEKNKIEITDELSFERSTEFLDIMNKIKYQVFYNRDFVDGRTITLIEKKDGKTVTKEVRLNIDEELKKYILEKTKVNAKICREIISTIERVYFVK